MSLAGRRQGGSSQYGPPAGRLLPVIPWLSHGVRNLIHGEVTGN